MMIIKKFKISEFKVPESMVKLYGRKKFYHLDVWYKDQNSRNQKEHFIGFDSVDAAKKKVEEIKGWKFVTPAKFINHH